MVVATKSVDDRVVSSTLPWYVYQRLVACEEKNPTTSQRVFAPRFPPLGPHMECMTLPNASARATTALGWLTSSFRNAHEPAVQVEEPEGFS